MPDGVGNRQTFCVYTVEFDRLHEPRVFNYCPASLSTPSLCYITEKKNRTRWLGFHVYNYNLTRPMRPCLNDISISHPCQSNVEIFRVFAWWTGLLSREILMQGYERLFVHVSSTGVLSCYKCCHLVTWLHLYDIDTQVCDLSFYTHAY